MLLHKVEAMMSDSGDKRKPRRVGAADCGFCAFSRPFWCFLSSGFLHGAPTAFGLLLTETVYRSSGFLGNGGLPQGRLLAMITALTAWAIQSS
jgi:hypothetical protein